MASSQDDSAQQVRNFLSFHRNAVLSSQSKKHSGYPFGSIVPYDIDPQGRLVIFISLISEHYRNLSADPHASLLIADYFGRDDPQAHARATVVGSFEELDEEQSHQPSESYWKRFPEAPERSLAHNFRFFRLAPKHIRWIGGFGDIQWIDVEAYTGAPVDRFSYNGWPAVAHMNEDHRDALLELLAHYHDLNCQLEEASMVHLNRSGFLIEVQNQKSRKRHHIPFPKPLSDEDDLREAIISLLKDCRAKRSP